VTILTDARVVQDDQVVEGGWVRWEQERLAEVGRGHLPVDRHHSAGGRLVVPGFVDIHDVGRIAPGRRANLMVLEENLTVRAVLCRGSWVDGRTP
jgi:N-acetylglucosamine-6-phosphate deacetylase